MGKKISRRHLLKLLCVTAGNLGLGLLPGCKSPIGHAEEGLSPQAYLPIIKTSEATSTPTSTETPTPTNTPTETPAPTNTPTATNTPQPLPTSSRVVHVHSEEATSWTGQTDFWNHVDQNATDTMIDQGMQTLTGTTNVGDAWSTLLPDYSPGQKIAIKVNFNNSTSCADADEQIDALIQPVNAIIRGLKARGVAESDIWVYDASRQIPNRFVNGCLYSDVLFLDSAGCHGHGVSWVSNDLDAYVTFNPPAGHPAPPATRIDDLLINCTYLINVPIMKPHRIAGVTLTFKNHFGDITAPWELHSYIRLTDANYRSDYNPLVDIYNNPHIRDKTVLVLGDGLIAARDFDSAPSGWNTFQGDVPNSLFLSRDPVAIDCVMCDHLDAELSLPSESDDYLVLASDAGLGQYERGDPFGSGYAEIDYVKIEL